MDVPKLTERPRVNIDRLGFNDGSSILPKENSIVVFTGGNNCGKSQILREIESNIDSDIRLKSVIISDCEIRFLGDIDDETFLNENFDQNPNGSYMIPLSGTSFPLEGLKERWTRHCLDAGLGKAFVRRLNTEKRITLSDPLRRNNSPEQNPIYKLNKNDGLASLISEYFHHAFGLDLVINRNEMQTIPLHVGKAPDKKAFTKEQHDEYYKIISDLPKLQDQGDGMRSFASVLIDTFTSDASVTLIDEPEAFLHPPQARILGKMLANNNPEGRQLFIATHSEDFLQGLLDANNENVIIVRVDRLDNVNKMNTLENQKVKDLWGNPIMRYSNILSGLFHEKVVVCESDFDCLFYQALVDSIYEKNHEISPDIFFVHCGGKARIKDVVMALKTVNDILNPPAMLGRTE